MPSAAATQSVALPAAVKKSYATRIIVSATMALAMALYFWVDSRYPSLLKKLHKGKSIQVAGALSFDALLPVTQQMPLATRIGYTTLNWMYTNRVGMTFGICFGAAVLTLLPALSRRRFQNPIANSLAGTLTGLPLGVCANCVAPIGQSLYQSGADPRTVLAAMISSPCLNVVVLAMLFALFPFPVAVIRVIVPLLLIIIAACLTRGVQPLELSCHLSASTGFTRPTIATLRQYLINLAKLAATTVPLMIVAGLLGAVAIQLLPKSNIPAHVSLGGVLLIALVGAFLPVPIAFDVAIAFLLFAGGVPLPYVVTLLCTLGAYSVYSVLILGRAMSWRVALSVYGAVALVGATAGLASALL
jgi:uncharacterized membrane protein YraQ (UPF0718 family)